MLDFSNPSDESQYVCAKCGQTFTNIRYLALHYRSKPLHKPDPVSRKRTLEDDHLADVDNYEDNSFPADSIVDLEADLELLECTTDRFRDHPDLFQLLVYSFLGRHLSRTSNYNYMERFQSCWVSLLRPVSLTVIVWLILLRWSNQQVYKDIPEIPG